MKYTSTSRTLSLLAHAVIFLAFGFMGIWFGFFVVPQYLGANPDYFYHDSGLNFDTNGAFFLWFELAVIGLVFMVISLLGFIQALKSLKDIRNDEPAVRSFSALICEGWIAAIFFLLQGALLWDLTANGNLVFLIVMALLVAIVLLIATNIPMVKIFDQRDQTPLLRDFIGSASLVALAMGVEATLGLIGALTWANQKTQIFDLLYIIIIASFVTAILAFFGWFILGKNKTAKGLKVSSLLSSGAIAVTGIGLLAYGILDIVYQYAPGSSSVPLAVHLYNKNLSEFDLGFGIMAIVIGSLLLIGAIVVAYFANNNSIKTKKIDY